MKTTLGHRKPQAYSVAVELVDRRVILASSPHRIASDIHGDRILYHRAEWQYQVLKNSDPEVIWTPGVMESWICVTGEGESLSNIVQGARLVRLSREVLSEVPVGEGEDGLPYSWPPTIEAMAADPASGVWVVYYHGADSLTGTVEAYDRLGVLVSTGIVPQPNDGTAAWSVPHAVLLDSRIYAIERDTRFWPSGIEATGRIVVRATGSVGGIAASYGWLDRYRYPHTLMPDPDAGVLWVLSVERWINVHGQIRYRTWLSEHSLSSLALLGEEEIHFGLTDTDPDIPNYWLGDYQVGGGGGGIGVLDASASPGDPPVFLTLGPDPGTWDPDVGSEPTLIRWSPNGAGGVVLDSGGGSLPAPIFRTRTGLIGAEFGHLPGSG